jgi:hypothetical protein
MSTYRCLFAACAVFLATSWPAAQAAPGDVVVPAHRTRDGSWVPANVPPSSGGTHLARRPAKRIKTRNPSRVASEAVAVPIFAQARTLRR